MEKLMMTKMLYLKLLYPRPINIIGSKFEQEAEEKTQSGYLMLSCIAYFMRKTNIFPIEIVTIIRSSAAELGLQRKKPTNPSVRPSMCLRPPLDIR